MSITDDEIHQRNARIAAALNAKIARTVADNPKGDPVKLANILADGLTPLEARYVLVDTLSATLDEAYAAKNAQ